MKNSSNLIIIILLFLSSCGEPPVVFAVPQPEGVYSSPFIEITYQGTYLCDSDSVIVHVEKRLIYKEKPFAFTLTPEEIEEEEGLDLIGDHLVVADWPEPLPATVTDSLIYSTILMRDTLFNMESDDNVLKFYKGHMILNKKITHEKWEVIILSLDNDLNLQMSIAMMPTDFERLEKITPIKDISTEDHEQILLTPTYIEFEEILKQQLIFEACDLFRRVTSVSHI